MSPAFDPRPWGTLDLSAIYPNHKFNERIGEAWLTGDNCVVTNGPLAKRSLADLSKEFGSELVGTAARDPQRFPLLLKFLFPGGKTLRPGAPRRRHRATLRRALGQNRMLVRGPRQARIADRPRV